MNAVKSFFLVILLSIAVSGLSVSTTRAATLDIRFVSFSDNNRAILFGATGIAIDGFSGTFDVRFVDSNCGTVFGGCTSSDPFNFNFDNVTDASAAAQALLDQVFLNVDPPPITGVSYKPSDGKYDDFTNKILGCSAQNFCAAFIPYGFGIAPSLNEEAKVAVAKNFSLSDGTPDTVLDSFISKGFSTSSAGTMAVFSASVSAVPLPAALPLYGTGLAIMGFVGWRKKRSFLANRMMP